MRPLRIEAFGRTIEGVHLADNRIEPLALHPVDVAQCTPVTRDGGVEWLGLWNGWLRLHLEPHAGKGIAPNLGFVLRRWLGPGHLLGRAGVVGDHVLAALTAERTDKPAALGKVVLPVMQVDLRAMPRQRDIGGMSIEPRRCQHMDPVDGHTLRLVDRRGVAVIDVSIVLEVKGDRPPIIGAHAHAGGADVLDRPQRPVLHAKAAFVLEEHDPVAGGKSPLAALNGQPHVLPEHLRDAHAISCGLVEFAHFVIGVRENDPAGIGVRLPVPVPAMDQIGARFFARLGSVDMPRVLVRGERLAGSPGGELTRRLALPFFGLTANGGDLDRTMPLGDTAERRARLDRLELLGIANEHDLGPALLGLAYDALHLARADHARLVDDKDGFAGQQLAVLPPLVFETGERSAGNARTLFEVLGCYS